MKKFWVRFELLDDHGGFELNTPWWCTGFGIDYSIFCVAVKAEDEDAAKKFVLDGMDQPDAATFSFVEERPADWSPFGGRFGKAEWMNWD